MEEWTSVPIGSPVGQNETSASHMITEMLLLSSVGQERPRIQDAGSIQHPRPGLYWTDGPFGWHRLKEHQRHIRPSHGKFSSDPLSGHKLCPLWALTSLHPDVLASFFTSVPSITTAFLRLTHLTALPYTSVVCPTHPYSFPRLFPRPAKPPLLRAILNSCTCLLLVRSVVVRETSGFILSHEQANGNGDPLFHFLPAYTIRADHSGRAVKDMKCLRPLERWDRGFESHSRHQCLCVRLFCVGSGLASSWPLVRGVLPAV
jgi:hypothetical protein